MVSNKFSLDAIDITKNFNQGSKRVQVLCGISASFLPGTSYAITGASGSGKSTFMHILGGLDEPTSGHVNFDNTNIATLKSKQHFLNKSIGFVFQFHYLIKELTVLENIMMMGLINGQTNQQATSRAQELLDIIGLRDKTVRYPGQLSGGEQQRVSIARAMMNKPQFLLADEPTGNLDERNADNIVQLFLRAMREWHMGIIVCTHDKEVYGRMEHVLHLHNGVLEEGGI